MWLRKKVVVAALLFLMALSGIWTSAVPALEPVTVSGVVQEGELGLELKTADQTYLLDGEDVPDSLAGRKLKITGSFVKLEDGSTVLWVEEYIESE